MKIRIDRFVTVVPDALTGEILPPTDRLSFFSKKSNLRTASDSIYRNVLKPIFKNLDLQVGTTHAFVSTIV